MTVVHSNSDQEDAPPGFTGVFAQCSTSHCYTAKGLIAAAMFSCERTCRKAFWMASLSNWSVKLPVGAAQQRCRQLGQHLLRLHPDVGELPEVQDLLKVNHHLRPHPDVRELPELNHQ